MGFTPPGEGKIDRQTTPTDIIQNIQSKNNKYNLKQVTEYVSKIKKCRRHFFICHDPLWFRLLCQSCGVYGNHLYNGYGGDDFYILYAYVV